MRKELQVKRYIEKLIEEEYTRAIVKYGMPRSLHEAESVLHEEIDEAVWEMDQITGLYKLVWKAVKRNDIEYMCDKSYEIKERAVLLCVESVQVGAMAQKILERYDSKLEKEGRI